jgi:hypothetical protein
MALRRGCACLYDCAPASPFNGHARAESNADGGLSQQGIRVLITAQRNTLGESKCSDTGSSEPSLSYASSFSS